METMTQEENITQDILAKNGFEYSEYEDNFQKKPRYTIDNEKDKYFITIIFHGLEKYITLKIINHKLSRCYCVERGKQISIKEINDALQLCGLEFRLTK